MWKVKWFVPSASVLAPILGAGEDFCLLNICQMEKMFTFGSSFSRSERDMWNTVSCSHHLWHLQNRTNGLGCSAWSKISLNKLNALVPGIKPLWNVRLGTWRQRPLKSLVMLKKCSHNSQHSHNLSLRKAHTGKLRINHSSQKVLNDRIWLQCLQFFTEMLHHVTFYCPVCMPMCKRLVLLLQMRWTTAVPKLATFFSLQTIKTPQTKPTTQQMPKQTNQENHRYHEI